MPDAPDSRAAVATNQPVTSKETEPVILFRFMSVSDPVIIPPGPEDSNNLIGRDQDDIQNSPWGATGVVDLGPTGTSGPVGPSISPSTPGSPVTGTSSNAPSSVHPGDPGTPGSSGVTVPAGGGEYTGSHASKLVNPSQSEIDEAIKKAIDSFNPIAAPAGIAAINPGLYSFSGFLSTFSASTPDTVLESRAAEVNLLGSSQRGVLWDNLYYQAVTAGPAAVANTIAQMLRANAFLKEYRRQAQGKASLTAEERAGNRAVLLRIAAANVVVPERLVARQIPPAVAANTLDASSRKILLKMNAADKARYRIVKINKIIPEVKDAALKFSREINSAAPEIREMDAGMIAAKTVQPADKYSGSARADISAKGISSKSPFSEDFLNASLTPEAKNYFNAAKKAAHQSLEDVTVALQNMLSEQYDILFKNSEARGGKIFYRGMVIPYSRKPANNSFVVTADKDAGSKLYSLFITQYFESGSTAIAAIEIEAQNIRTGQKTYSSVNAPVHSEQHHATFHLFEEGLEMSEAGYNLRGRYETENGTAKEFFMPRFGFSVPFFSLGRLGEAPGGDSYRQEGSGAPGEVAFRQTQPDEETPEERNAFWQHLGGSRDSDPYGPGNDGKHLYGVKRIGILDFKRVEQKICCYVAGEVSHIENIMAREYKEKATRNLSRTEIIQEDIVEKEVENLTDTTSTDRFEMNKEISQVLQEERSRQIGINTGLNATYDTSVVQLNLFANANLNFTNSSSATNSFSESVAFAKEIVERTMQRIVEKVTSKRTSRMLREYEETNKHGFDNRKGDKHVTGIYRWVDKIYENRLINYGKRLQYEFMAPEPARNFKAWMTQKIEEGDGDDANGMMEPKKLSDLGIAGWDNITEVNYADIAAQYGAEVKPPPDRNKQIFKAFSGNPGNEQAEGIRSRAYSFEFKIPEGYKCNYFKFYYNHIYHGEEDNAIRSVVRIASKGNADNINIPPGGEIFGGHYLVIEGGRRVQNYYLEAGDIEDDLAISVNTRDVSSFALNVLASCDRKEEFYETWQQESYLAIVAAYKKRSEEYYNAQPPEPGPDAKIDYSFNPVIGRSIEQRELKRICIELMLAPFNRRTGQDDYKYDQYSGSFSAHKSKQSGKGC